MFFVVPVSHHKNERIDMHSITTSIHNRISYFRSLLPLFSLVLLLGSSLFLTSCSNEVKTNDFKGTWNLTGWVIDGQNYFNEPTFEVTELSSATLHHYTTTSFDLSMNLHKNGEMSLFFDYHQTGTVYELQGTDTSQVRPVDDQFAIALKASWEYSKDAKELTYRLLDDDGNPVDEDIVVFVTEFDDKASTMKWTETLDDWHGRANVEETYIFTRE